MGAPFRKATAEQWRAALSRNVAAGEREWTGVDAYLRANAGKVLSRRQVHDAFREGRVILTENVLGGSGRAALENAAEEARSALADAVYRLHQSLRSLGIPFDKRTDVANALLRVANNGGDVGTVLRRYAGTEPTPELRALAEGVVEAERRSKAAWNALRSANDRPLYDDPGLRLPGGENYREILIRLGDPKPEPYSATPGDGGMWDVFDDRMRRIGSYPADDEADALEMARRLGPNESRHSDFRRPGFTSAHYEDYPDLLVHVRVADRVLPNGEKVLFVEEIQSDWHQQGREKGYLGESPTKPVMWTILNRDGEGIGSGYGLTAEEAIANWRRIAGQRADQAVGARLAEYNDAVPNAPFRKTEDWLGLAMKRIIDEAVAQGYDRVAWTTGAQQVARYNLARYVDAIRVSGDPDQGLVISAAQPGRGYEVIASDVPMAKLADYVGKDIAEKVAQGQREFTGVDLHVGGEGLRKFYDTIVPGWVRDYAKKMGVRLDVEPAPVVPGAVLSRNDITALARRFDEIGETNIAELLDEVSDILRSGDIDGGWREALEIIARDGEPNDVHHPNTIEGARHALERAERQAVGENPSFRVSPELRDVVNTRGQFLWSTPVGPATRATLSSQSASSVVGAGVGALSADEDATGEDRIARAVVGAGVGLGAARLYRIRGAPVPTTRYAPGGPVTAPGGRPPRIPGAESIDAGEHVNLAKFALDPTGQQRLTDMVRQLVARRRLDPKQVVTWEETRAMARELGVEDVLTDPSDARRLTGPEMLAIRELVRENIAGIEHVTRRLADDTLPDAERETLTRVLAAAEQQTDALLHRFIKARSQTGRDLNNLKIIAQQTLDPVVWLSKAKRALGDAPLTEATRTAILEAINQGDRGRLAQIVANLKQHSVGEKLAYLWKAGLLTMPRTHLSNVLGNTSMLALEVAKDVPAFVADRLLAGVTGATTKAPVTRQALAASWRGAKRGAAEARRIMRGEAVPDALARYDIRGDVDLGNAFLTGYARTVFRALSAADRIFKGAALERSLVEQATVIARNEGLAGAERLRRIQELVANPSDEMALRAIHDAEVATFQDRTRLGSALGSIKRQFGSPAEFLMPFTRTPSAVATRVVEYSPFGLAKGLWDALDVWQAAKRGAPDLAKQRKAVEALGRGGTGLLLIWIGYDLAREDKISGAFPEDSNERARWQLEGRIENAVLVDGKWRSIEKLGPLGQLMVLGANLFGFATDPEKRSALDVAGASAASIGRSVVDQSGFTGINEAQRALDDPGGYARKYLSRQAASVVPAVVGGMAAAADPVVREAVGPRETIAARIPGLSDDLPAKLDVFGRPTPRESGLVANLFDPFYSRTDRRQTDPLVAELARVGVGVNPAKPRKGESPAAFRARQRWQGPILERALAAVIGSDEYQALGAEAAALVQREPRYRGQDAGALARELKRSMLEQTIRTVRSQLTRATTQAGGR